MSGAVMRRWALAVAAAAAAWVSAGSAAVAAEGRLDVVSTVVEPGRRVEFVVSAPRELLGVPVPAEAFRVVENGQPRPAEVRRLPSGNLDVALVIDTSGSMEGAPLAAAKAAAVEFIGQLPPETRIAVVGFGAAVRVASAFSTDHRAVTAAVNSLKARGETALYDALDVAAGQLLDGAGLRRSIVLLSDGGDTVSRTSLDAAAARVAAARAEFFAVALATSESDGSVLTRLAGGDNRVVAADNPTGLAGAYRAVASQLVNRYQIRFTGEGAGETEVRLLLDAGAVQAQAVRTVELPVRPVIVRTPEPVVAGRPGLLGGRWTLAAGAVAFAGAFALAGWLVVSGREPHRRLAREWAPGVTPGTAGMTALSRRAAVTVDRFLTAGQRSAAVNRALDQAGIAMRPGGFVALALFTAAVASAVGAVLGGLLTGLVVAALTLAGFRTAVSVKISRRRVRFADQLGDTLQLLAGGLRTGYGLIQAIDSVAREADVPTCEEFRRVVIEHRLGRDLSESLRGVSQRMGNDDFEWVVQAIAIHRDVGGDLAEVLDNVGDTIRDRNRIRRQVRALSAEGRLSAGVLFVLPFAVGAVVALSNPGYLGELTGRTGGRVMLGTATVLMGLGGLWLRRLVQVRF